MLALNELRIDSGERRHLNKLLIEGFSESPVPFNNIDRNINSIIPNTGSSNLLSSTGNSNEDGLRESSVDTTLSILKMQGLTPDSTTS
ncbi:hypothetical protein PIROE2DRAFT_7291 [Piromyces sp. E2]|nr:hypothetical protein PIROE2DRAFT_7291 [Piromyces sp. E2]|eukprot:OUM65626.1 hypothetical protein PIROE2DRAFT_7291 [Piromyces sp. E2]